MASAWVYRMTDHLRSRGADAEDLDDEGAVRGSPPLARSRLVDVARVAVHRRITSARAEPTDASARPGSGTADHLRSRGADVALRRRRSPAGGSPPLARSRHPPGCVSATIGRITSARAEPTAWTAHSAGTVQDHLRSRGADCWFQARAALGFGSPPLARSRRHVGVPVVERGRITSARAEPTKGQHGAGGRAPDHLRSRGADDNSIDVDGALVGSPPLARSRRRTRGDRRRVRRITSARAEPTIRACLPRRRATDHLRSRGADPAAVSARSFTDGSPPLARSRRSRRRAPAAPSRITSARAEPTNHTLTWEELMADHLRSRGADSGDAGTESAFSGSPPLARSRLTDR